MSEANFKQQHLRFVGAMSEVNFKAMYEVIGDRIFDLYSFLKQVVHNLYCGGGAIE